MTPIEITNCHVHSFTRRHLPAWFPHPLAWPFVQIPWLVRFLAFLARVLAQHGIADRLDRLHRFRQEAWAQHQSEILDRLIPQYPARTRFVVLPMELGPIAVGAPQADLRAQHDELARLAEDPRWAGRILPFATCHPDHPGAAAEVRRCIEELGFHGLKLYPRLGFAPDHPVLMQEIYPLLLDNRRKRALPVMSHCSRGGVTGRHVPRAQADDWSAPLAFVPVLERFSELQVCLAHFGGQGAWRAYIKTGIDPRDGLEGRRGNWQVTIRDMITGHTDPVSGAVQRAYPNLWTDISYTLFHFDDFVPFLVHFLRDPALAQRVLFGSDFYMTRQEALSERAVCFRLRAALGDDLFRQIAQTNPRHWLGEA